MSLYSREEALAELAVIDENLERVSAERGAIGAVQSRLEVAANTLLVARENYLGAAGRIMDADIAEESASLVRLNILQQAASAILAQANQQPNIALQLLG